MNAGKALVFLIVLSTGGCGGWSQQQSGALLGAGAGAAAGSAIGRGSGRTVAIVLGALVGSAAGANIGRHMDEQDRVRTAQAMDTSPTGQPTTWVNPDTRTQYSVTPTQTYQTDQGPCREFTMEASVGNSPQQVYGTACRQPDGSWKIVK